jgi:uncharacterized cupin superfamily protein
MKQIMNIAGATPGPVGNGAKTDGRFASLGAMIGACKLGGSPAVFPPGKRAFPKHARQLNEEMMFVLEGRQGSANDSLHGAYRHESGPL